MRNLYVYLAFVVHGIDSMSKTYRFLATIAPTNFDNFYAINSIFTGLMACKWFKKCKNAECCSYAIEHVLSLYLYALYALFGFIGYKILILMP